MAAVEHIIDSSVRGFYVYKNIWTPTVTEQLKTRQEPANAEDRFAVAVYKDDPIPGQIVGHVPKERNRICWYFLQHDGEIACDVTGPKRRSPLAEGGLEIPCKYNFVGKKKYIKKLKELLK